MYNTADSQFLDPHDSKVMGKNYYSEDLIDKFKTILEISIQKLYPT